MSEASSEPVRGRRQTVSLANLYLDPNNFRFADNPDYRHVASEDVFKPPSNARPMRSLPGSLRNTFKTSSPASR